MIVQYADVIVYLAAVCDVEALEHDDRRRRRRLGIHQEEDPGHAGADTGYSPLQVHDGPVH